jgi:hypothetical protein
MRLRTFSVSVGLLTMFGILGFWVSDLERRVATLSEQLGVPHGTPSAGAQERTNATTSSPASGSQGYEQRLSAIERRLNSLMSSTGPQTSAAPSLSGIDLQKEEAILSVVERENSRIRDVQLEWHRARWMEGREQQLAAFAAQLQLQPAQTAELHHALEHEVDAMVTLLKSPDLAENPDVGASDWQAMLTDTDERVKKVLTPEQQQIWTQARLFERRVLWPWLPKEATAKN